MESWEHKFLKIGFKLFEMWLFEYGRKSIFLFIDCKYYFWLKLFYKKTSQSRFHQRKNVHYSIYRFFYITIDITNGTGTLPRRTEIGNMDIPLIKPRVLSPSRVVNAKRALPKDMEDLIHLPGPLTEDAVMRTLQARFAEGKHFVSRTLVHLCFNNLRV